MSFIGWVFPSVLMLAISGPAVFAEAGAELR
jgi:hypothetical protein